MNAFLALVLGTAALGVDVGWQPTGDNSLEYIIQIEPHQLKTLKAGDEIDVGIRPELRDVRRYRIVVGNDPLPREGAPQLTVASPAKPIQPVQANLPPGPVADGPKLVVPDPQPTPAAAPHEPAPFRFRNDPRDKAAPQLTVPPPEETLPRAAAETKPTAPIVIQPNRAPAWRNTAPELQLPAAKTRPGPQSVVIPAEKAFSDERTGTGSADQSFTAPPSEPFKPHTEYQGSGLRAGDLGTDLPPAQPQAPQATIAANPQRDQDPPRWAAGDSAPHGAAPLPYGGPAPAASVPRKMPQNLNPPPADFSSTPSDAPVENNDPYAYERTMPPPLTTDTAVRPAAVQSQPAADTANAHVTMQRAADSEQPFYQDTTEQQNSTDNPLFQPLANSENQHDHGAAGEDATQTLENPQVPAEPVKGSSLPLTVTLLALFASIGGNVFLAWMTWDFRRRYRYFVSRLRQNKTTAAAY